MRVISADVVVTPQREIANGYVVIDDGVIVEVGEGVRDDAEHFAGALIPGFVDIHCHGGGGFSCGKVSEIAGAAKFHLSHGTTTMLASMVSSPLELVAQVLLEAEPLVESDIIAGIHLEGPFLALSRCGAQNPAAIVDPTPDRVDAVLAAGKKTLRHITIAPERPGALEAISRFVEAGVTVAAGHSDATAEVGKAAFDAGASVITHFGNGMRPYDHEETCFGMPALDDDRVSTELIADGVHVSRERLAMMKSRKESRFVAVTDAIVAAGMPDGDWDLGGLAVTTTNNVAHLSGTQTLAGSTLTMDRAFGLLTSEIGFTLQEAAQATATEPARVLHLNHIGAIEVGKRADLVVWNDRVTHVIRQGTDV